MNQVIPTVFAKSKREFEERFSKVIGIADYIQIDFMDGDFVKSKSVNLSCIPNLTKYKGKFEAHLMVKDPAKYARKLKNKGFKKIIFHYEAFHSDSQIKEFIKKLKGLKFEVFIAINPETPAIKIVHLLESVDGILVMGVYPGREHQKFLKEVYRKIKAIRKIDKKIIIEVDGGVNDKIAKKLRRIGVNEINSGSYISESEEPKMALKKLKGIFV